LFFFGAIRELLKCVRTFILLFVFIQLSVLIKILFIEGDEGHMLKNDKTGLNKAMKDVKTKRRIALTGTPMQNNLGEYYCMVSFVKPNLLGTIKEFNNRFNKKKTIYVFHVSYLKIITYLMPLRFANPISNGQTKDSTDYDVRVMKRCAHVLHKMLECCVQRKDYGVIRHLLKPKHEYVLSIRLTDTQIDLYRRYLRSFDLSDIDRLGKNLFSAFQNLSRICSHPYVLKLHELRVIRQEAKDAEKAFVAGDDDDDNEGGFDVDMDDDNVSVISGGGINKSGEAGGVKERWWSETYDRDTSFDVNLGSKLIILDRILKLSKEKNEKL
jgi:transcriptional regulator ATRX